jgi:three-Cys-motif partner protein
MVEHQFGGPWTEEKLNRLRKYLPAYTTIFTSNQRAAYFRTRYVDAFAGTGFRQDEMIESESDGALLDVSIDQEAGEFRKGSAYIALETVPPFSEYIFIERSAAYVQELTRLRELFPALASHVTLVSEDANVYLQRWCRDIDWRRNRAVVFLDPYGMQVEWSTIAAMAATSGIDLWILFPLGIGVNRLLLRERLPEGPWADRLTILFGTDAWRQAFYRPSTQQNLFGEQQEAVRDADFERIAQFWMQRLQTVFPHIAPNPLPLRNSRNVPLYLLCFAASNPRGGPTAVRIAQDILSR